MRHTAAIQDKPGQKQAMIRDIEMHPRKPTMKAIVTTGVGGYDKLELRDVAVPEPGPDDVPARNVGRRGQQYRTQHAARLVFVVRERGHGGDPARVRDRTDGGWNAVTPFPLIQGTDCCGRIVAVGSAVDTTRIGQRVIVRGHRRRAAAELSAPPDWKNSNVSSTEKLHSCSKTGTESQKSWITRRGGRLLWVQLQHLCFEKRHGPGQSGEDKRNVRR